MVRVCHNKIIDKHLHTRGLWTMSFPQVRSQVTVQCVYHSSNHMHKIQRFA